jgi:hypothetical protein
VSLTPRELSQLAAIEAQLAEDDPALARRLEGRGRVDWDRYLGPLTTPVRFWPLLGLLLAAGPIALSVTATGPGVLIGLAGYLLAIPLVMARMRLRPPVSRLWRHMAQVMEDGTPYR